MTAELDRANDKWMAAELAAIGEFKSAEEALKFIDDMRDIGVEALGILGRKRIATLIAERSDSLRCALNIRSDTWTAMMAAPAPTRTPLRSGMRRSRQVRSARARQARRVAARTTR